MLFTLFVIENSGYLLQGTFCYHFHVKTCCEHFPMNVCSFSCLLNQIQAHAACGNSRSGRLCVKDELINYLETSTMRQLTEAVDSLRMLGQRPDARILSAVVCSLQRHCDASDASAHDTIEILRGLAALGFQPSGPVLDQICFYLKDRLQACTSEDISR